ncbi:aminoacyl-tRNA hydrolase [Patescibacteria group bacterium]|nr:aminoacyl-tRNA hydrolase [Patescibacteria group bacterium]MBU0777308.1 aminoacyl-tRNA hydrolase [Patescibacteria group bacterium]MBU0846112.1 aminoacyl-tRNA hydrolase [Patescibacteria group bacterium]MBU0923165.1 aminoacyl-tRNA hydrolase [Patescibacteria group bacterium]MBU1066880.1 aminoacyl-tRNA hydrolase [Patescibacteria group bacterium]
MTEEKNIEEKVRLIIAYGNPGIRYAKARSNVGYMIIDYAVEKVRKLYPNAMVSGWAMRSKYMLMTTNLNPLTMVVKPRTPTDKFDDVAFGLYAFYRVIPEDFYIIYPDENLTFGQFDISKNLGSAPEAILKMEKKLNSKDFWKVRIGIGGANEELNEVELAKIKFIGEKMAYELEIAHIT